MVKLLDFRERWAELEVHPNPFALVVMAHLEAQAVATESEGLRAKVSLIRRLYGRGHDRKDIIQLFRFIDWLMVLPADLEVEAVRQIAEMEGATPMPYVTSIERLAQEKGIAEGKAEGRAEGKAEGLREGLLEAIDLGLELRFGKEALRLLPRVRAVADLDRLRALKSALPRVATLAEFESQLGGS
jgi:predicted transposase YdaD